MEPFFLRCETCHARLRVRDERFLGQIQSCPKCGSMVQIIAPAGWLAQSNAVPEAPPELTEIAAANDLSPTAKAIGWIRSHAVVSAAGATGIVAACGLAAFLTLRGEEPVASRALAPQAVEFAPLASEKLADKQPLAESGDDTVLPVEPSATDTVPVAEVAESESTSAPEAPAESVAVAEPSSSSFLPLITPPKSQVVSNEQSSQARTLKLEPVEQAPRTEASTSAAYPPEIETEPAADSKALASDVDEVDQSHPAADQVALPALDPPLQRTNIKDQLAVPIESINMPAMPIGEFVTFVSTMTAVPIELDAKVLGEVGLSSRSTVTVEGKATTAGKLLARVLKEHQLTCIQRDGMLVVVRAKR